MIRFNCHCTHEFLANEDQAGGLVQCPKCGRLNDIPTLSDLGNIESDGSFKIGEKPTNPGADVAGKTRAFTSRKQDHSGRDIDLRHSVEEFLSIADQETFALADEETPAPKYDPFTGELIAPMDVKADPSALPVDLASIPIARRVIGYAQGDRTRRVTPGTIALELFRPVNLFVLFCVALAHVLLQLATISTLAGFFLMAPILFMIGGLLLAHYGNIIDETGPTRADELPRPLRDLGWSDDLWGPFIHVAFAFGVCFMPAVWMLRSGLATGPLLTVALFWTLILFALFFLPAVLITTTTSGSISNLRPDRVIGVIRACGSSYVTAVILCTGALIVYLGAMLGMNIGIIKLFSRGKLATPVTITSVSAAILCVGIYLAHLACWLLGLLYRAHYDHFPWVHQRHVSTRRKDTIKQLEERRARRPHVKVIRPAQSVAPTTATITAPITAPIAAPIAAPPTAASLPTEQPVKEIWQRMPDTRE